MKICRIYIIMRGVAIEEVTSEICKMWCDFLISADSDSRRFSDTPGITTLEIREK